ncbi:MAG: FitA-like ribbon-helix-helix domain-containing protein [Pseudomarimonas sp.]
MNTFLTLKGIPEPIYRRVTLAAARNHRSMNSEIKHRSKSTRAELARLLSRPSSRGP